MAIPKHVAIIMDGNGRWATGRGYERILGHLRGARVARAIIEHSANLKLPYLTLYAFSSENWFRPTTEVTFLMRLLKRHLQRERDTLMKNNIRFHCIGDLSRLPSEVQKVVAETMENTKTNTGMQLTFALSYSSRQEILSAVRDIAEAAKKGELNPSDIEESMISQYLESSFLPDPDLIIRTSGEQRLSNFLLWQAAYAELYLTETLWPDFTEKDFDTALASYSRRERRFGRTAPIHVLESV